MENNAQRCRAMALLCRQQAALHPETSWKSLGQAERWEHLADTPLTLRGDDQSGCRPSPSCAIVPISF